MTTRRSAAPTLLLVIFAAALLLRPAPALAQGTSGTLPDPITMAELLRYGERLGLSPQQQVGVEPFHQRYRDRFRELRDGSIADFLSRMHDLQAGMTMPERERFETFMKEMNELEEKIEQLDRQLFDEVATVLSDEQITRLDSVRQARTRKRYQASQMGWMGGRALDITEVLLDVDPALAPETRETLLAITRPYENRLTELMSEQHGSTISMFSVMFDAIEAEGLENASMEDPEQMKKIMEVSQRVMQDIFKSISERAAEVHELNLATLRRIAPLLSAAEARDLRAEVVRGSFPALAPVLTWHTQRWERAAEDDERPSAQRQQIREVLEQTWRRLGEVAEAGLSEYAELHRTSSMVDPDRAFWNTQQEITAEHMQRAELIRKEADAALVGITGLEAAPDQALSPEELMARNLPGDAVVVESEQGEVQVIAGENATSPFGAGPDMFLPPAITPSHLGAYQQWLQLGEQERTIAATLLEDYRERYRAIEQEQVAKIGESDRAMWRFSGDGAPAEYAGSREAIERTHQLRQQAMQAIEAADAALLEQLAALVPEERRERVMEHVRLARERERWQRGQHSFGMGMMGGSSNEALVDLDALIVAQRLPDPELAALDEPLLVWQRESAPLLGQHYRASLDLHRAQAIWNHQWQERRAAAAAAGEDDEAGMMGFDHMEQYQELLEGPSRQLRDARQGLAESSRRGLDQIIAALPAERAQPLRDEYNRRAFPEVYNDAKAAHEPLRKALQLGDLSGDQQSRLATLAIEYRQAYDDLSKRMCAETDDGAGMLAGFDREAWPEVQQRMERFRRLRYERDELNHRTLLHLGGTLTEEQVKTIGGLPDLTEVQERQWWE